MYRNRNIQHWNTISVIIFAVFVFSGLANLTWLLSTNGNDKIHDYDFDVMRSTISRLQGNIRVLEASVFTKDLRWKGMEEMSQFYVYHMRRFIISNRKCTEKLNISETETIKMIEAHKEELKAVKEEAVRDAAFVHRKLSLCQNEMENEKIKIEKERKELDKKTEYYKSLAVLGLYAEGNCSTLKRWSRDKTLEDIYKVFGVEPLLTLYKAGGDLGSYLPQIQTLDEKREIARSKDTAQPSTDAEINIHHPHFSPLTVKAVANMKTGAKANTKAGTKANTKAGTKANTKSGLNAKKKAGANANTKSKANTNSNA